MLFTNHMEGHPIYTIGKVKPLSNLGFLLEVETTGNTLEEFDEISSTYWKEVQALETSATKIELVKP